MVREKCLAFVLDEVDEAVAPAETAAGTTKVMAAFISKQLSFKVTTRPFLCCFLHGVITGPHEKIRFLIGGKYDAPRETRP